ncbi:MAG: AAA family ATPase [Christensenellaceae bacterium]|jgi:dephospho-CoA kinase|nr:AAA family ATPase [Christensenellaceae bacterium]
MGNKIIAIVGMCGSGKSEVAKVFNKHGFLNVYFGEATFDEMKRQKLELTPENEKKIRESLRAGGDKAIYAKLSLDKIEKAYKSGDVTLESMYSWAEYEFIKQKFGADFEAVAVVTDKRIRYNRLTARPVRPLTLEQAAARDQSEIENLDKAEPIAVADYFVLNNGTQEQLIERVEEIIAKIKSKK